jgi:galactose-1-phosphate uridylyltransferase
MFKKYEVESKIRLPKQFKEKRVTFEIRVDPLTKETSRIIPPSENNQRVDYQPSYDFPFINETEKDCHLCYNRIEKETPKFPKEVVAEGRFVYNNSVLFPNPYSSSRHAAVSTLSPAHFVETGNFLPEEYLDSFINARQYLKRVFELDDEIQFSTIAQNHLPPSGDALIHPHLLINAFVKPPNYLNQLFKNSRDYYIEKSQCFWENLVEEERKREERVIAEDETIVWLTPFAPRGIKEVWAIAPRVSDVQELGVEELMSLSRGIAAI